MQNISVYLNNRASNGSQDWKNQINTALFRSDVSFMTPENLDELYSNLDQDLVNNVDAVMSVGGDGTVNTIIQRLAGTDVSLLVVPGGTANDFARTLGSSSNVKSIAQTIRSNSKKKIDLININGKFMATNGGLGFASDVAFEINELRKSFPKFKDFMKLSGKSVYSLFLAKKLIGKEIRSHKFKIVSNELNDIVLSPLILINNQPALAGNFNVAPNTNHQDGKFNVTIFTHENRLELISAILKILSGEFPYEDKKIKTFETSEINLELIDSESLAFFGDGEIFDKSTKWNIKCYPQFLSVYAPNANKDEKNLCTQVSLI